MILGHPQPRRARIEAKRAIDHSKGFRWIISCSLRACLTRRDDAGARRAHQLLNPRRPLFCPRARAFLSQRYIFDSAEIGNFDDARRSNADADAHETWKSERNVYITSIDASIVARGVRCAPRGVAQIDRYVLRHVIGEPTVVCYQTTVAAESFGMGEDALPWCTLTCTTWSSNYSVPIRSQNTSMNGRSSTAALFSTSMMSPDETIAAPVAL